MSHFDAIIKNSKTFVIAEAGVNHNGSLEQALKLVDIAADAGADAVKFQTFRTELVMAQQAPKAAYQRSHDSDEESQFDMVKRLELPAEDFETISRACHEKDILFLSTPFDQVSADFLEKLDIPFFKIPSGEITNLPFLKYLAGKNKPVILSTGMSNLNEVKVAVDTLRANGCEKILLLHCVSSYPTPIDQINLRAMITLGETFQLPYGLSDHTTGIEIPPLAVAMGAIVIEKHFTSDKLLSGPDHAMSLDPKELKNMVKQIRLAEKALGHGDKIPSPAEIEIAMVARRSVVAARPLNEGEILSLHDLVIKRPGTGISPTELSDVIGCTVKRNIKLDTVLTWDLLYRDNEKSVS